MQIARTNKNEIHMATTHDSPLPPPPPPSSEQEPLGDGGSATTHASSSPPRWLQRKIKTAQEGTFSQAPCITANFGEIDVLTDADLRKRYRKQRKKQKAHTSSTERHVKFIEPYGQFRESREDAALDHPFFRIMRSDGSDDAVKIGQDHEEAPVGV